MFNSKRFINSFKFISILYIIVIIILTSPHVYSTYEKSTNTITLSDLNLERVVDGDTIWVKNSEKQLLKVRFLATQAPELWTEPPQLFATEATNALKDLLYEQKIYITYEKNNKTDKYGRILADIYTESGTWVNGFMIEQGLSHVYILNNQPVPNAERLIKLENQAIAQNLPFWQTEAYKVINISNTSEIQPYVNQHRVVDGRVTEVINKQNASWLLFETTKSQQILSIRITKQAMTKHLKNPQKLVNKHIRVRGFINQHAHNRFYINVQSVYNVEVTR